MTKQRININRVWPDKEPQRKLFIIYRNFRGEIVSTEGIIWDRMDYIRLILAFKHWGYKILTIRVTEDYQKPENTGKFLKDFFA